MVLMRNCDLTSWLGFRRWVKFFVKMGAVLALYNPNPQKAEAGDSCQLKAGLVYVTEFLGS